MFVGDGPVRTELEAETVRLGLTERGPLCGYGSPSGGPPGGIRWGCLCQRFPERDPGPDPILKPWPAVCPAICRGGPLL